MTDTTRDILDRYQVRKTRKQKSSFIEYMRHLTEAWGYSLRVERGAFGARNLVVGEPSRAKVVYTAHYDTCPVLPFPNFITPKCFALYLVYQLALVLAFFAVAVALGFAMGIVGAMLQIHPAVASLIADVLYLLLALLLLFGPANRHTANDNTSGVTLLVDVMRELPADRRDEVAFIFFDLEEMGLFGSRSFARKHRGEMKQRLLVNFDCVSDGDTVLLALKRGALPYRFAIEAAFAEDEGFRVDIADRGVFYPSDQANFPCGVGVATLRRTKGGLLYMNRIHTRRDVIYREENIAYLKSFALALVSHL